MNMQSSFIERHALWLFLILTLLVSLVIPVLFHAGQNYFVFLNGGGTPTRQLALFTITILCVASVPVLGYGIRLDTRWVRRQSSVPVGQNTGP